VSLGERRDFSTKLLEELFDPFQLIEYTY